MELFKESAMTLIKGGNKPKKGRKGKLKALPKFSIGQLVYVFIEGGYFSAHIEDVYRVDGNWIYDVDCNMCSKGLELSMPDCYMTDKTWEEPPYKFSRRDLNKLIEESKEL